MIEPHPFAAALLEQSASGFGALAAERLLTTHPGLGDRWGLGAHATWRAHLTLRVRELAAAVAAGHARMFVDRVRWSRRAFEARGLAGDDVAASLRCLGAVLKAELPPPTQSVPDPYLTAALATLNQPDTPEPSALDPTSRSGGLALRYLHGVLIGEVRQAIEGLAEALATEGAESLLLKVLLPAQREVGRLWHAGQLRVAEEHLVTSTTQRVMAVLADRATAQASHGKTAVAATVAGNTHDIGIRAITYLLELRGWRALYLGPDLPEEELPRAIAHFSADVVLLSSALSVQLGTLARTIEAIREHSDRPVQVMVGGHAFVGAGETWRELGADGYAEDGAQALALADRLAGLA